MAKDKDSLKDKYRKRIEKELEGKLNKYDEKSSSEYKEFISEFGTKKKSLYEKACALADKYIGIEPDKKKAAEMEEACAFAYLQLTPKGVYSFGMVMPIVTIIFLGMPTLFLGTSGYFLFFLLLVGGLGIIPSLLKMPFFLADNFRMKASNQMVLSTFYLVTYMRHTSNLERAIEFAANYLSDPMAYEFKKILWDVETGNFDTISESIENFLTKWQAHNAEFVDAVHLIESSLYEGSEQRRLEILDKSLEVILDETYEKMLHFAHNLQSPITTLHMLGIILPILGLVILPLMLSFMEEVKWYHISVLYNVFLPIVVFFMGHRILSKRPSGCGETNIKKDNKEIMEAMDPRVSFFGVNTGLKPKTFAFILIIIFTLIGFFPLFYHMAGGEDFGIGDDTELSTCGKTYCFLEYKEVEQSFSTDYKKIGPFGLGATLLSLSIILGLGLGAGLYYTFKSSKLKEIFDRSHKLETEFSSALFQLGNKLGDNLPAEVAVIKIANSLADTQTGKFFRIVSTNIQKLGMSVQEAIFNSNIGALVYYPSELIESSMKVLIQAVKKGPLIASNAVINISRYVKEMHKVEDRLKDLMAEVISSMKSQIGFLTPIIAAIVVGITSMISTIINFLSISLEKLGDTIPADSASQMTMITSFFKTTMPPFYFQLIVGIYVLQITFILTILINSIENGSDEVNRDYLLGKNMVRTTLMYVIITGIIIIIFNVVAMKVMPAGGL